MKEKESVIFFRTRVVFLFLMAILLINASTSGQSGFPFVYNDNILYYPKLHSDTQSLATTKANLLTALKNANQVYDVKTNYVINARDIRTITTSGDGIEIEVKGRRKISFEFERVKDSLMFFFGKPNGGNYIYLPSLANFAFSELNAAQYFADNIYSLQYSRINKLRDSLLHAFAEKLSAFKKRNEEAFVSGEQKKLFIAADSASIRGDYFESIRLYNQAIELNEFSYSTAYANLALLYAHINFFDHGIYCMKKFLMMEPETSEARKAQDKIYEWEGIIRY